MTKEELEKENVALKGQLEELSKALAESESNNEDLTRSFADLNAKYDSIANSDEVNQLLSENQALKEQLKELAEHVKTSEVSHEANRVVIKHKNKSYFVNAPQFRHNGEVYKAKELSKFPEVIEDLLDSESSILEPTNS